MKSKEVVSKKSVQNLFLPRADAKHFGIRPGDVPELGHDEVLSTALLENARQQAEVIVLDEDKRGVVTCFVKHGVREDFVDPAISLQSRASNLGRVNVMWLMGQRHSLANPK